jgi:hypothetical protein
MCRPELGVFSGSTESGGDADLEALNVGRLDELLDRYGGLCLEHGHFNGWSLGERFYPILYMITRMGGARDWGNGLALDAQMPGKMSSLEVHHIFPKGRLYEASFRRADVNALLWKPKIPSRAFEMWFGTTPERSAASTRLGEVRAKHAHATIRRQGGGVAEA